MDWISLIIAIVAVYGAGLSTYNFILDRRDKQRKIKVDLSYGFPVSHNMELMDDALVITVSNPGNRQVTINTPSIRIPDGKKIFTPHPNSNVSFPHTLDEGKNCIVWFPLKEVKYTLSENGYRGKVKMVAQCTDQVDNIYESEPMNVEI